MRIKFQSWNKMISYRFVIVPFISAGCITFQKYNMICSIHRSQSSIQSQAIFYFKGTQFVNCSIWDRCIFFLCQAQTLRMVKDNLTSLLINEALTVTMSMAIINSDLAVQRSSKFVHAEFRTNSLNLADLFNSTNHDAFREYFLQIPVESFAL